MTRIDRMLLCAVGALGVAPLVAPASAVGRPKPARIAIDLKTGQVRIRGTRVRSYRSRALRRRLGRPDRVVREAKRVQAAGGLGSGASPGPRWLTYRDTYRIYDRRGLVFRERRSGVLGSVHERQLQIFFRRRNQMGLAKPPRFSTRAPFAGTVMINGQPLDPRRPLVRTRKGATQVSLFGLRCTPSRKGPRLVSVHCAHGQRTLDIRFADRKGRPAYLTLRASYDSQLHDLRDATPPD